MVLVPDLPEPSEPSPEIPHGSQVALRAYVRVGPLPGGNKRPDRSDIAQAIDLAAADVFTSAAAALSAATTS